MENAKCIADFDVNSEEDYINKEHLIECLHILNKLPNSEFDESVLKLYSIRDKNGNPYNKYIFGEKEINNVEYHTTSNITKECRKALKKPISIEKIIDYILCGQIQVSKVNMCAKSEFDGMVKCINKSYDNRYFNNINSTLIDAYFSRVYFGKENSYLRNIFDEDKINNDISKFYSDLVKDEKEKQLFLSFK